MDDRPRAVRERKRNQPPGRWWAAMGKTGRSGAAAKPSPLFAKAQAPAAAASSFVHDFARSWHQSERSGRTAACPQLVPMISPARRRASTECAGSRSDRRFATGRPTYVHEVVLGQIRLFLRRGNAPENGIAMREPSEAGDGFEVAARLIGGKPIKRLKARGSLKGVPLGQRHDTLQPFEVARAFRMREGHEEERLLPRSGEGVVVTVPQAL